MARRRERRGGAEGRAMTGDPPPAAAPHRVPVPLNLHRWEAIAFLHWGVEPDVLAALVPSPLTVLTADGLAWVGVTPFRIHVRLPGMPGSPPGWVFPETNVRTYVRGPDGREGLWFLHMEVPAAWFVAALRTVGLPYVRRRMAVEEQGAGIRYRSAPRRSEQQGGHDLHVVSGPPIAPVGGGPMERFLTARWAAYHRRAGVLLRTPVEHEPWPLHTAEAPTCDAGPLFHAAGLPDPGGDPLVHWSPGVTVRVGAPALVGRIRS